MAFTVAALAAGGPSVVEGIEAAEVSFPGFARCCARSAPGSTSDERPAVVAIDGAAGSGKSTLARRLARASSTCRT